MSLVVTIIMSSCCDLKTILRKTTFVFSNFKIYLLYLFTFIIIIFITYYMIAVIFGLGKSTNIKHIIIGARSWLRIGKQNNYIYRS